MKNTIVVSSNTSWYLFNFRSGLTRALIAAGYEVVAAAPPDDYSLRLEEVGCRFVPLPMDNEGTNPATDLLLLWRLYWLLRRVRPAALLTYTVKPNIYGSMAARALGMRVINNVAGLGAVFIRDTWLTRLVRLMYRLALARSHRVFFQNGDDLTLFIDCGLVREEVAEQLPGSGVDLARFVPAALPVAADRPFRFLLLARMLWDKGIGEFVEAARAIRRERRDVEFCLLGFLDVPNPAAISRAQVQAWVDEGVVYYLGSTDDVRRAIAAADCVTLPSYREGVPRSLLEAAAMERPVIAADSIGCREAVEDGVTGYLCRPRDAGDLTEKMRLMLALSPGQRADMGRRGREKMIREFDERAVIERYLKAVADVAERA